MKQTKYRTARAKGIVLGGFSLVLIAAATVLPAQENSELEQVRQGVDKLFPKRQANSIQASSIPGLYEVMVGAQLYYISADGKYLLTGDMFDIDQRKNLSAPKLNKAKAKMIGQVKEADMVIFAPEEYQHTVTVFTDIDCGYCRKLHSEIKQYNDQGIRVRYMMYPRAGIGSPSFQKAVNVFCADDRNTAMTRAKAGETLEDKKCQNPVAQQYALGQAIGVNGTPAIFLEDGELVPGYVPADRMAAMLKKKASE